jgi:AcrR family transcriptional regulator
MSKQSLRSDQIESRRKQILEAASRVFSRVGFHRATTRQIACEAGVAEGTIFNYFDTKDDLLIAMLQYLTQFDRQQLEALYSEALRSELRPLLQEQLSRSLAQPQVGNDMFAAVLSEALVNADVRQDYRDQHLEPFLQRTERHIQQRIARGELRRLDAALFARIYFSATLGLGVLRLLGDPLLQPDSGRIDELVNLLVDAWLEGIST